MLCNEFVHIFILNNQIFFIAFICQNLTVWDGNDSESHIFSPSLSIFLSQCLQQELVLMYFKQRIKKKSFACLSVCNMERGKRLPKVSGTGCWPGLTLHHPSNRHSNSLCVRRCSRLLSWLHLILSLQNQDCYIALYFYITKKTIA